MFDKSSKVSDSCVPPTPAEYDEGLSRGKEKGTIAPELMFFHGAPLFASLIVVASGIAFLVGLLNPPSGFRPVKLTEPNVLVWVINDRGTFYCAGSVLWGREPGELVTQGVALGKGYQPASRTFCKSRHSKLVQASKAKSPWGALRQIAHVGRTILALFDSGRRSPF